MRKRVEKGDEKKEERERGKKINGTEHVSAPCPSSCSVRLISIRFSGVADGKRDAETKKISTRSRRCP